MWPTRLVYFHEGIIYSLVKFEFQISSSKIEQAFETINIKKAKKALN